LVQTRQEEIVRQVAEVKRVAETLEPEMGPAAERARQFDDLQHEFANCSDPFPQHAAKVMSRFRPGLFVGDESFGVRDNLDLERSFRIPKGHERRIHGRCHAGVRIVQEGATLIPALDAHVQHPEPFDVKDLYPYRHAQPPPCEQDAIRRRRTMRLARSTKTLPDLLAQLETRYINSS
jgi:hypothetical protein